jgi:hypothetical protein
VFEKKLDVANVGAVSMHMREICLRRSLRLI